MRINDLNARVSLYRGPQVTGDADGYWEALDPPQVWASIEPQLNAADDRGMSAVVRMRFHVQMSVDCKLVYNDRRLDRDRHLIVRGVQSVMNRHDEMVLFCEEVQP